MGRRLYVGNLSYDTTELELKEVFGKFGTVTDAKVVTDRETGRPRGFAFVEMSSDQEAQEAIAQLSGRELGGRALNVNEAQERSGGGGGGGRGGGGGGGRGGGGGGGGAISTDRERLARKSWKHRGSPRKPKVRRLPRWLIRGAKRRGKSVVARLCAQCCIQARSRSWRLTPTIARSAVALLYRHTRPIRIWSPRRDAILGLATESERRVLVDLPARPPARGLIQEAGVLAAEAARRVLARRLRTLTTLDGCCRATGGRRACCWSEPGRAGLSLYDKSPTRENAERLGAVGAARAARPGDAEDRPPDANFGRGPRHRARRRRPVPHGPPGEGVAERWVRSKAKLGAVLDEHVEAI
jgi:hypothetical protein